MPGLEERERPRARSQVHAVLRETNEQVPALVVQIDVGRIARDLAEMKRGRRRPGKPFHPRAPVLFGERARVLTVVEVLELSAGIERAALVKRESGRVLFLQVHSFVRELHGHPAARVEEGEQVHLVFDEGEPPEHFAVHRLDVGARLRVVKHVVAVEPIVLPVVVARVRRVRRGALPNERDHGQDSEKNTIPSHGDLPFRARVNTSRTGSLDGRGKP